MVTNQEKELSPRELEVLEWLAAGWTHKQVGEKLGLTKRTIDAYAYNLRKKLQCVGIIHGINIARENGWIK